MPNSANIEKYQALKEARENSRKEKAQKNLNKYSTGKNKGQAQENIKAAKNLIKNATPWGIASLFFQMKFFSDWMYGLALLAAIFKDVLDILNATGIGYFIVVVATFLASIFIAMMMLLGSFSNGSGRAQQKMIRSWLILLGGTTTELLFGVNFLPIETATVLIIYALLLSSRKQGQEEKRNQAPDYGETQENYA